MTHLRGPSIRALTGCLVAVLLGACANSLLGRFQNDPLFGGDGLAEVQRRYTRLVRWGEFSKASAYVDPELLEAFLREANALSDLRITDYEIERIDVAQDGKAATAFVNYRAYWLARPVELPPLLEAQEWYRDPDTGGWRVRPHLAQLTAENRGSDH